MRPRVYCIVYSTLVNSERYGITKFTAVFWAKNFISDLRLQYVHLPKKQQELL